MDDTYRLLAGIGAAMAALLAVLFVWFVRRQSGTIQSDTTLHQYASTPSAPPPQIYISSPIAPHQMRTLYQGAR